jgi:glycolate oxidase FAD binding subunit
MVDGLAGIVGQEFIKTEPDVMNTYAVDNVSPKAVVFPKNTQQVSEVVQFAVQENLAIVPWGSGSKIDMGNPPNRLDLVVCTSRMNDMLDVDTANLTVTIEAGVRFRDIQARLATQEDRCYLPLDDLVTEADEVICSDRSHSGCFLPMDPSFSNNATIGGIVATNSSGPRRLLYNLPRDMILGVRFVTPRGDIVGTGGKVVKNVSGYDISKLMVGSMGSLGILCDMTFKLLPLPEQMETLLVCFDEFSHVSELTNRIFETTLLPAAVEVMNGKAFSSLEMAGLPHLGPGGYVVAIAFEAFEEAVNRMVREIKGMAMSLGAKEYVILKDHAHPQFWLDVSNMPSSLAKKFSGIIRAKLNYRISEWKEIFEFVENTLSQRNLEHTILAHAGSGICAITLLMDQSNKGSLKSTMEALELLLKRSREGGGNLIIQHAPTDMKKDLKIWGELDSNFIVMKRLKQQVDPSGILSPGRFLGDL